MVTQSGGKQVPVVQAFAYTKYLGHLDLTFDDNGNLNDFNGNPILLSQSFPEGKKILLCLRICFEAHFIILGCSLSLKKGYFQHTLFVLEKEQLVVLPD